MSLTNKFSALRSRLSKGPLQQGNFVRNVLTVATGTALAQAITIAAMPILSRMYSPAAFGLLATFVVLCDTAYQVACLGYQGSIVLPKRDQSAHTLWVSCICIGIASCILAEVVFLMQGERIAAWLGNPELEEWLWLVPVVMLIMVAFETTTYWCTRHKKFGQISTGIVSNRLAAVGTQLALGAVSATAAPSGLLIGNVFGSLTGLSVISAQGMRNMPAHYWKNLRLRRIFLLLHRYRHFPGYGLLSNLFAAAGRALPVICLGYFFTPAIVGFFAMSNRLVTAPIQLLSKAVVQVFYERANRANVDGNLGELTAGLYERMVALIMTPMGLLGLAAPDLIAVLLGGQWIQSGVFMQWLVIWLFFVATISPLHKIFLILERQRELAVINVVLFLVSAAALIAGGFSDDATLAIAFFAIASSFVRVGQALRVMFITGASIRTVPSTILKELLLATPFFLAMAATRFFFENTLIVSGAFMSLIILFAGLRAKKIIKPGRI